MQQEFHQFNVFSTKLIERLWYLDTENKTKFFPCSGDHNYSPMHYAAEKGNLGAIQFYLEHLSIDKNPGIQVEGKFKGRTPMHIAAEHGNLEMVQMIKYSLGIFNPSDANGISVLHIAAKWGHLEVVEELVKDLDEKNPQSGSFYAY